ncbi:hypothetical protein L541_1548 [Bordetella hinzii CA90 BAL1384]|nr:hypothetical protein L541_1548 [Bordetella hinzii CA90 BAL1384]
MAAIARPTSAVLAWPFMSGVRGPDLPDGVGDALAVDVRRRAMDGLEQRRELALGIEIGRGRDADGAGAGRPEIGKDVAEQIRGHHHIEPVRMLHKVRAQDVDVVLVPAHVRILRGDIGHALIPPGHGDRNAIGLGRRGQVLAALARQLEGELEHPVGAHPREDAFLYHHLALGAREQAAAAVGILAFGVFADDVEIDLAGLAVGQWRGHARHQAHRTQVDVLIEIAAETEQRTPQRLMVGHGGRPADGAEENGLVPADLLCPVIRHHLAVPGVIVAAPVKMIPLEADAKARGGRVQHAQPFRHHFLANTVAGNHGDSMCLSSHPKSPRRRAATARLPRII